MTRQEFIEKMGELFPGETPDRAIAWAGWLEKRRVPLKSMHAAFYGVHQQYGGELAGLMYLTGPRHYCLYPNEFLLAAEYLYQGGTLEQIDERPSHVNQPMELRQGGPC